MKSALSECLSEFSGMMAQFRKEDEFLRSRTDLEICKRVCGVWYWGWYSWKREFERRQLGKIHREGGVGPVLKIEFYQEHHQLRSDCICLLAEWEATNNEDEYFNSFTEPKIEIC